MTAPAIVLIGPMGAGKSSIGKKLARVLGTTFTDSDALVVRDHGPIERLFAEHGEERFRELERLAVAEALARGGVVALGGGAVLHPDTRSDVASHRVVLLTVSEQTIASRLAGTTRPLLQGEDPVKRWREVAEGRRELYEQLADARFDTSTGRIQDIVDAIAAWAQEGTS
ncbi:shikimate kinase [Microbacterium arborescens]|jgi:shikimate kinase|uniref:Shikimate kinase n=2 Tax=Microbacterium TaxID=33882 RepID=A0ABU1HWW5_9MICO|nr:MULTISPECIES: shikimate kinase [Microbacterium]MDR6166134.1 shikimate kinase [Microbacterium paludicola]OAZ39848.1 shikimate kinase [Microbacterium arborescens]POX67196.1 shikimate kinase [Microbacterium sp. Ru50]QCR40168.1 shikimate kinase [Microbacterium sp. SGAir0570]